MRDETDHGVADLLACLLARGEDARALARATAVAAKLLELEGLEGLARSEPAAIAERLSACGWRGPPRGAAIAAAFELGRRLAVRAARVPPMLASTEDAAAWAIPRLGRLAHEELWVLSLDGQSRLRAARCIARGGLHGVAARAADPLRAALRADATAFVLVHNHPSGDPTPSREDIAFTESVAEAARAVGVPLVDHVVVASGGFASVPLGAADA